uniref:Uncharacterized protein n=1 Tax=Methanosarcina barkeri (strain Fusaro / DSM 804) TaxID=269797 RepID=Q46CV9_METBF
MFPPNSLHSIISLKEDSVLYEIKGGSYVNRPLEK